MKAINVNLQNAGRVKNALPSAVAGDGVIHEQLADLQPISEKGAANGYAPLDASGLVPSLNLPSYVDDVIEGAALASFPATGESGKIYIDLATNKQYRWGGTVYVDISEGVVIGAENGVNVNSATKNVELGGLLTKNTTITQSGFDLSLENTFQNGDVAKITNAANIAGTGAEGVALYTDNTSNVRSFLFSTSGMTAQGAMDKVNTADSITVTQQYDGANSSFSANAHKGSKNASVTLNANATSSQAQIQSDHTTIVGTNALDIQGGNVSITAVTSLDITGDLQDGTINASNTSTDVVTLVGQNASKRALEIPLSTFPMKHSETLSIVAGSNTVTHNLNLASGAERDFVITAVEIATGEAIVIDTFTAFTANSFTFTGGAAIANVRITVIG